MYSISFTNQFKKDIKRCQKRNYDFSLIEVVFELLSEKGELPSKYKPHKFKWKLFKLLGMSHKRRLAYNLAPRRFEQRNNLRKNGNAFRSVLIHF